MEELREGTVSERKEVLRNMNNKLLKTLVNIIGNVLESKTYKKKIIKRKVLSKFTCAYEDLLDRNVPLHEKKRILQKNGYIYLPIFLEIVGDDTEQFEPKEQGRTLKDCPVPKCKSKRLKKLSNHLHDVHGINDRQEWLEEAKESMIDTDDDDDDDDDDEDGDEEDDDETDGDDDEEDDDDDDDS